jgi:2-hydroxy-6-oxonona-2,4-dienedioate hydrolase
VTVQDQIRIVDATARRAQTVFQGGTMTWRVWGSGAPVLLLHGGSGSWTHWIRNIPFLSARHTVLVPDMPGYGESNSPPVQDVEVVGRIISDALDAVVPRPEAVALVGFSFGATVAGFVARLQAARLRRFVLVGAGALGLSLPARGPLGSWRAIADPVQRRAVHRENLGKLMIHDPALIDDLAVALQARNAEGSRFRSRHIARTDVLRQCLDQISVPLSGIWGEHDVTSKGFLGEREALLRRFDPAMKFVVVPGAGHWVQYEAADRFNEALDQILARRR